jgi:hypothetical protein
MSTATIDALIERAEQDIVLLNCLVDEPNQPELEFQLNIGTISQIEVNRWRMTMPLHTERIITRQGGGCFRITEIYLISGSGYNGVIEARGCDNSIITGMGFIDALIENLRTTTSSPIENVVEFVAYPC